MLHIHADRQAEQQLGRAVIAFIDGDKEALDIVLDEVAADRDGAARLVLGAIALTVSTGSMATGGRETFKETMQQALAKIALADTDNTSSNDDDSSGR